MYPLSLFSFLYLYQTWTLVLNQANVFLFSVFHHLINTSWAIALRLPLYGYSGKVVLKGLVHLHLAINWQTFEVVWQVRHTYTVLLNDTKDTVSKHCIIMLSSSNKAGTAHKAMAAYTSKFLLVLVMWVFFFNCHVTRCFGYTSYKVCNFVAKTSTHSISCHLFW